MTEYVVTRDVKAVELQPGDRLIVPTDSWLSQRVVEVDVNRAATGPGRERVISYSYEHGALTAHMVVPEGRVFARIDPKARIVEMPR